jgi:alpha-glucosidase
LVPLLLVAAALAQPDIVSVSSPDGHIEFQIFNAAPARDSLFTQLGYRILLRGKPLMDTSFMVFAIQNGEPLLGEKLTLLYTTRKDGVDEIYTLPAGNGRPIRNNYNSLIANYLQTGTTGRSLSVEVRAYDDGVAFRYFIPRSSLLEDLRIEEEETDFHFAQDGRAYALLNGQYTSTRIGALKRSSLVGLPFLAEQPGVGWVAITEAQVEDYAGMSLFHAEGTTMRTTLPARQDDALLAVHGTTPVDLPWRVLMIASEPRKLLDSEIVKNLNPKSAIADTTWIKQKPKDLIPIADTTALEEQFARLQKAGAAGVTIDLMNRSDQQMIGLYRSAAKLAAAHHLMIEFLNGPTSDGIERTWPNVLQREDTEFTRLLSRF